VRFVGAVRQDEVAKLLESADVYLAPSLTASDGDIEGIPVSIMEAMAAGLPVVSTQHSAIPELVTDGVSGFLAAERDISGLADYLTMLANDPGLRARMGAAGRDIVVREFEIDALNDELERRYRDLL
jgi:colanic acid/amylovoran biosynthesis glycosyltransferase